LQAGGPEFESLQVHHDSPISFSKAPPRPVDVMKLVLALCVFLSGLSLPFQAGMNAQLRASLGHGLLGALVNFLVGVVSLFLVLLIFRVPAPSFASIASIPAWAWGGGILGAFLVAVATFAARDLGALPILMLVILGQALGSVLVDHFGLMGYPVRPISPAKILACVLLIASVLLVKFADAAPR
jgi:transporter family-2 protein